MTDPSTGTFGSNFNSEIIQEQQVIVSGVPAEYAGGSGLISRVVTKSGGNEFHGSLNYYFQNDGLVAKDEHTTSGGFSTYDTAATLGGPIIRDRLWFYGSYQKKHREDEVLDVNSGNVLRTVTNDGEYTFGKLTWQITDDDRLTASYFEDPTSISGSNSSATLNNRDVAQEQGARTIRSNTAGPGAICNSAPIGSATKAKSRRALRTSRCVIPSPSGTRLDRP